ncbi:right-handed parallel beta-helix repeat-containing protein [Pseudomonas cremoricolorata]|uniref:right-handed parallel beta-helix repeat-containing protein n=1 Tax=Pseudomonas cremoricolorata TaxID=157783 RepID=UPI00067EE3E7|nr:right-handed parallel beta-helix repeat-containing protein [Pseudomonas cremoricolorata]
MRKMSTALALSAGVLALSGLSAPAVANDACDLSTISVKGEVKLNGQCTYHGGLQIRQSNTSLDCNGATLVGDKGDKFGIMIKGTGINNIKVSNCRLLGYDTTPIMIMSGEKSDVLSDMREEGFLRAPYNVVLDKITIEGTRGNAVHFNGYVNNSVLKNSKIIGSRGVAVYLGGSTRGITLENNVFSMNGGVNEAKQREAVAVDSSARNIIRDNKFVGNAAGGIFLYKNCGEYSRRPGAKLKLRWQPADDNLITRNTFSHEKIGVWVASRQSKDLSRLKCGDPSVDGAGKFYRDYADNNVITDNFFCSVKTAVRIEGDNNRLAGNMYDIATKRTVLIPFAERPKPDGSVSKGNVLDDSSNRPGGIEKCDGIQFR